MTNLSRLSVSLTKHGSHKIAALLDTFPPDEVVANTWGKVPGINIDAAQARKVLSASSGNIVPAFWHKAKKAGRVTIDGLVLLAIVFSHHRLIEALEVSATGFGIGVVKRTQVKGKAYTNLKAEFENLNTLTRQDPKTFSYDLRALLRDKVLGKLALSLFQAKLVQAGWTGKNAPVEECIAVGFHRSLGMTEAQFRLWTSANRINLDELPEAVDPDTSASKPFQFRAGHVKRKSGNIAKRGHGDSSSARLIHNDLQNKLFDHLVSKYGKPNVGSELTSGPTLTSIDVVVRTKAGYIFFEIKTSTSLRKCVREAVPQLLEYAYWPAESRASALVIVSTNAPTSDAKAYLNHLRTRFGIPIFHQTMSRKTGVLSARI